MTYLDVPQLAERWHTTPKAVYAMKHRGELPPAVRIGRRLLWADEDVQRFEQARREGTRAAVRTKPRAQRSSPVKDYSDWFKSGQPA